MIVVLHVMYAPLLFMGNTFYEWGRCRYQHLYARFCDSYCTHVAFTAMISDLLYKTIKAGNILTTRIWFTNIFAENYNGIHHHIIKFYIPVIKVSLSNSGNSTSSTLGFLSQQ